MDKLYRKKRIAENALSGAVHPILLSESALSAIASRIGPKAFMSDESSIFQGPS